MSKLVRNEQVLSGGIPKNQLEDIYEALDNKQDNLGFTPVQQGGGTGQGTNKVYIGWATEGLKVQVDWTDLGALAFRSDLGGYLQLTGGTITGNISGSNGGHFAPDGNSFLNVGGYADWLSNILNTCYKSNGVGGFNTGMGLSINGQSIVNGCLAQFEAEYNGSVFRIRNDGGATYFMNGNASAWTNHTSMDTAGNWTFNGGQTLSASGGIRGQQLAATGQSSATVSAATNCNISANGLIQKTSNTSSKRFKDNITADLCDELNPHHLYDIEVIQFKYKKDYFTNTEDSRYRKDLIGFIAEDIHEKYPIAADYHIDEETNEVVVDAWNPQYMIPPMLKLIQEQKAELDAKEKRINELENRLNTLEERMNELCRL